MSDCVGVLSLLFVYPVKSCAGIALESTRIAGTGLAHDRAWMIVDQTGRFVTQRQIPHMCWIGTALTDRGLVMSAPGFEPVDVPFDRDGPLRQVTVWNDTVLAADMGDAVATWLDAFLAVPGRQFRLVRFAGHSPRLSDPDWTHGVSAPNFFSDGFPVLVITQGAIDELNRRLRGQGLDPVGVQRFRPNIVLSGLAPHEEDQIGRLVIPTGTGAVALDLVKPCARCSIPDINPNTAMAPTGVAATLAGYRGLARMGGAICVGMNAIVREGAGRTLHTGLPFTADYAF